jgi:hypothetical protein
MDASGNLAIGYSVSNTTTFPSIRFSGRLASDPLNTLTVAESDLRGGTGSQTHTSGRWGDYSMLAVDPSDGCTFWFTSEYYLGTSSAGWKTNIGSFSLANCGGTPPPPTPPAAPSALTATAASTSQHQSRLDRQLVGRNRLLDRAVRGCGLQQLRLGGDRRAKRKRLQRRRPDGVDVVQLPPPGREYERDPEPVVDLLEHGVCDDVEPTLAG